MINLNKHKTNIDYMKKYIIMSLLCLFLVSVSAQSCPSDGFMGTFAINKNVIITQTCPTCNFLNITIKDPSSNIIKSSIEMTLSNGTFNYNLPANNVNKIGTYFVEGFSNLDEPFISCFQVNQSGIEFDNLWMNFIIIFLFSFASFALIYTFNESRQTIKGGNDNFIYYYLGSFMLFILGTYTLIFGFGGYITLITEGVGYILWGSGLFFMTKPYFSGGDWKW